MSDASGSVSWSYDVRGRLVSELRQVGSYGSFASAWGYNSADGLAWRQYPGGNNGQLGELVSYSYDQRLQLATVTGDYAYVSASAYDAAGRLVQRSLGNAAVLSQYSYYPWEQQGGRLQQLLSGTPADSDSLQDLRYTYDLSGNLLSLQDYLAGAPQTQVFDYDALDRLVSAFASGGDSSLGDYSLEMAYDPGSGNLRQKGELYHQYLDSGHSHAVTALSDGWRYEYDPNGNLVRKAYRPGLYFPLVLLTEPEETLSAPPESQSSPTYPYPLPEEQSRAEPSGLLAWLHSAWDILVHFFDSTRQTALAAGLQQAYPPPGDPTPTPDPSPPEPPEEVEYGYDAENRLVSVISGEMQVSFVYDGDGQRVASLIDGAATVYIGEVFEWEVTTGSMRRYYYAGTQRVATRLENASPVWLLGDHLGSTSVAANTDGSLLSRQGYLPWGELRFAEGGLPGRYQFTGQASYEAEFGLYYYKARWYDPSLGRWASPDSITPDPGNPLDWDRYSYARNSPLNYIDPTGHEPWFIPGWNDAYLQLQDGNTCAVVSIAVVFSIYSGSVITQSDVQPLFPNTYAGIGVPPVQQTITLRLVEPSLQATFSTGTREDILESLLRGDPVLVSFALPGMEVGHAVAAIGYDPDTDEIQFFNPAYNKIDSENDLLNRSKKERNFDSFDEVWSASNIFIPPNSMITFHQETIPIPALPDLANVFGASHVRNRMLMR